MYYAAVILGKIKHCITSPTKRGSRPFGWRKGFLCFFFASGSARFLLNSKSLLLNLNWNHIEPQRLDVCPSLTPDQIYLCASSLVFHHFSLSILLERWRGKSCFVKQEHAVCSVCLQCQQTINKKWPWIKLNEMPPASVQFSSRKSHCTQLVTRWNLLPGFRLNKRHLLKVHFHVPVLFSKSLTSFFSRSPVIWAQASTEFCMLAVPIVLVDLHRSKVLFLISWCANCSLHI